MTASIKLDFVIDKDYLIAHTFSREASQRGFSSGENAEDIFALQARALSLSERYSHLVKISPEEVIGNPFNLWASEELSDAVVALKRTAEYQNILAQTQKYKRRIELEWDANLERSSRFMRDLTGLPLDKTYTVFVTHPSLHNGMYLGNRRIAWGGSPDFENYDTVYLWHEVLHDAEHVGTDGSVGHAIIELVTDNGLRVNLNGSDGERLIGHSNLDRIRRELHNYDWPGYLASDRNIRAFKAEMEKKYRFALPLLNDEY